MRSDITKQVLIHTLLELSKTIAYKNLLISDLTDAAGVSRNVFFYHFKNKEAFLESALESIFWGETHSYDSLSIQETFSRICAIVQKQRHFVMQVLQQKELRQKLFFIMRGILASSIKKEMTRNGVLDTNQLKNRWLEQFNSDILVYAVIAKLRRNLDIVEINHYREDFSLFRDFFANTHLLDRNSNPFYLAFSKNDFMQVCQNDQKLMSGIKSIAKNKDFNLITTQDIIDSSQISRATFYRKYQNKHELRNHTWAYDIFNIFQSMSCEFEFSKFELTLINYYRDNINLYKPSILQEEDPEALYFFIKNKFEAEIRNTVKQLSLHTMHSPYAIDCIAYAITNFSLNLVHRCNAFEIKNKSKSSNDLDCDEDMLYIWESMLEVS